MPRDHEAVQGSLAQAGRLVLRNHLETCVAAAMQAGRTNEIVDEVMEALRYEPHLHRARNRARIDDQRIGLSR